MKNTMNLKYSSLISFCLLFNIGLFAAPNVSVVDIDPIACPTEGGVGTITLLGSNGVGPYEYSLDGINFQLNPVLTTNVAGPFIAFVRDANLQTGNTVGNLAVVADTDGPVIQTPSTIYASLSNNCDGLIPDVVALSNALDVCTVVSFTQTPTAGTVVAAPSTQIVQLTAADSEGNITVENVTITVPDPSAVIINTFPFVDDFEGTCNGWVSNGPSGSWQVGAPTASQIHNAASGSQAWVINLNGAYGSNDRSFLFSPTFDFTNVVAPYVRFQLNLDTDDNTDGVALQYSTDNGISWNLVHAENAWGQGSVTANPGDQPYGWSGSSNGWRNMSNYLPGLGGESSVQFRFGFASTTNTGAFEGVGIDRFEIFNVQNDIGLVSITPFGCSDNETFEVTIINKGSTTQNNIPLYYKWNTQNQWNALTIPTTLVHDSVYKFQANASFPVWYGSKLIVTAAPDDILANNSLIFDPQCSCETPTGLLNVSTQAHWATVGWTLVDGAQGYVLKARRPNGNWQTIIIDNPAIWYYDFVGVKANTTYQWKVATVCDDDGQVKSNWSSVMAFTTPAASGNRLSKVETETAAVRVWPNPTNEFVIFEGIESDKNTTITFKSLTGRQFILDTELIGSGLKVNVANL